MEMFNEDTITEAQHFECTADHARKSSWLNDSVSTSLCDIWEVKNLSRTAELGEIPLRAEIGLQSRFFHDTQVT